MKSWDACFPRTQSAPMAALSSHRFLCTGVTRATFVFCFWTHWIEWVIIMSKICHEAYPSIPCAARFAWVPRAPILAVSTLGTHFRHLIFISLFYFWVAASSDCSLWSEGLKCFFCNQHSLWNRSCIHNTALLSLSILPPLLKLTLLGAS